jgi:hypothetical protein
MKRRYLRIEAAIVVLALVLVAVVAWTLLRGPLSRRQVHDAADTIRTALFRARQDAMRNSQVYVFQYKTGSGAYRLAPQHESGSQASASAKSAEDEPLAPDDNWLRPESGDLPQGIQFLAGANPDSGSDPATHVAALNEDAGEGWSDPIFFYPDGTTSDAQLSVANNQKYTVHIKLRGVTGNVTVGQEGSAVE